MKGGAAERSGALHPGGNVCPKHIFKIFLSSKLIFIDGAGPSFMLCCMISCTKLVFYSDSPELCCSVKLEMFIEQRPSLALWYKVSVDTEN